MKRRLQTEEVLNRYLPRPSPQIMESNCNRILDELRSQQPSLQPEASIAHSSPLLQPRWKRIAVIVAAALVIVAGLASNGRAGTEPWRLSAALRVGSFKEQLSEKAAACLRFEMDRV
jgi:hypothetical protein